MQMIQGSEFQTDKSWKKINQMEQQKKAGMNESGEDLDVDSQ